MSGGRGGWSTARLLARAQSLRRAPLNEAGPYWAARAFSVLAPAAPGFGESPAFGDLDGYRLTPLADLIPEVADRLGLDRFDYVGWSWGASIGVHLAARHPDRLTALVLLDGGHTDAQDVMHWTDSSVEGRIAAFEAETPTFSGWDELLALASERATDCRPALEKRLRAGMELELPILLVVATRNDTSPQVARFRSAVPRATVLEVDSEHDLFAHAPEETSRTVADWLLQQTVQPKVA